jgi:hypothetical protein
MRCYTTTCSRPFTSGCNANPRRLVCRSIRMLMSDAQGQRRLSNLLGWNPSWKGLAALDALSCYLQSGGAVLLRVAEHLPVGAINPLDDLCDSKLACRSSWMLVSDTLGQHRSSHSSSQEGRSLAGAVQASDVRKTPSSRATPFGCSCPTRSGAASFYRTFLVRKAWLLFTL